MASATTSSTSRGLPRSVTVDSAPSDFSLRDRGGFLKTSCPMSSDGIGVGGYAFGPRSTLMLESLRALPVDFGTQWLLCVDVAGDVVATSVASSLLIEGVDSGDRLLGCSTRVDPVNALLIPRPSIFEVSDGATVGAVFDFCKGASSSSSSSVSCAASCLFKALSIEVSILASEELDTGDQRHPSKSRGRVLTSQSSSCIG